MSRQTFTQPSKNVANPRPAYSLYRLQYDLAQLADELPAGIRVVTDDSDMSKFCLILEPQDGYLEGCRIHLSVEVPMRWPCVPLVARIDTPFEHPNVYGGYICCDILKTDDDIQYYRNSGYKGGYTPAYSLVGTFMQLASFFSDANVEQDGGRVLDRNQDYLNEGRETLLIAAQRLVCRKCRWNCEDQVTEKAKAKAKSAAPITTIRLVPGSPAWIRAKSLVDNAAASAPAKHERKPELTTIAKVDTKSFQYRISVTWSSGRPGSLDDLHDDILLHIVRYLDTSSLLVFGALYPRFGKLLADTNEISRREIRCYVTKRDPRKAILGIGLRYDASYKTFFSSFDYVSRQAFDDLEIRKGANNDEFDFWMPLAIDEVHYAEASGEFEKRLSKLNSFVQSKTRKRRDDEPRRGLSHDPVRHLIAMANALVVDFMKVCDANESEANSSGVRNSVNRSSAVLLASERALAGYCSIVHLLASFALQNKRIISAARGAIKTFRKSRNGRTKSAVPDIGQFIVMLCLVDEVSWVDVRREVVDELFTRAVVWQLQPKPQGAGLPGLAYLEESPVCEWRLQETFKASRTGIRLLLFQVFFMEKLAKRKDWTLQTLKDDFDSRRGLPPPGLTAELLERIQFIYKMDNLGTFAKELGAPASKEGMTKFLRERVTESIRVGYHQSTAGWDGRRLLGLRARDDKGFGERLKKMYGRDIAASEDDQPSFFPGDDNRKVGRKAVQPKAQVQVQATGEAPFPGCNCSQCTRLRNRQ